MPKVTDEHRLARRKQILDAAWAGFAHNGFHATTMADISRESGLSAGAVYGYFRSKEELIQEAASGTLAVAVSALDRLLAEQEVPDPADAVMITLEAVIGAATSEGLDRTMLAMQSWSEALRSPRIKATIAQSYNLVRERLTEVVRRGQGAGQLAPDVDPDEIGSVLFSLLPGFVLQRLILGDVSIESYARGVRGAVRGAAGP